MSEIAAPALTPAAVPHPRAITLNRVRHIGYAVLGLQLIGFMAWSALLYNRYSLTADYAAYHQAWYEIAHGDLTPFNSYGNVSFLSNHAELIYWPLSLLYWVWPHDLMLQWIQDFTATGAAVVAFTWMCELAGKRRADSHAAWFAAVGLILLVANPWTWQALSFDIHTEQLAIAPLMLLLRDLANGRRRAWAWVPLILLCGDVAATYVIGAGLGTALAKRGSRVTGLALVGAGLLTVLLITSLHLNGGSGNGLQRYAYLAAAPAGVSLGMGGLIKGVLTHPWIPVRIMAAKSADIWANLAPSGFLGIAFAPVLPAIAIVLVADNLWPGLKFSQPGFQSIPLYFLVPTGTVAVLGWLVQRRRVTALALSCLVVAQALTWAALWGPWVPRQWLRVPADAAATLAATQAIIPPSAEVIASQGIAGRFSDRTVVGPVVTHETIGVHGEVWFIIAPTIGIETESPASAMAFIGDLAGPVGATLVSQANGVWVFRWHPPAGVTAVTVPGDRSPIPAWVSAGPAGTPVLSGPASAWHAAATGAPGYVADQLAWQVPTGRYVADVTLATSGPVNVEVWNDTGDVLVTRRTVLNTDGPTQVTLPVNAVTAYPASAVYGPAPFRAEFLPPHPGQRLEVRVWSAGNTRVDVYGAELIPAGSSVIP
jgi:predicted membrane protein DUF2079